MVPLTPAGAGLPLGGAAGFGSYSVARSASVFRCLVAGSGTARVSGLSEPFHGGEGLFTARRLVLGRCRRGCRAARIHVRVLQVAEGTPLRRKLGEL